MLYPSKQYQRLRPHGLSSDILAPRTPLNWVLDVYCALLESQIYGVNTNKPGWDSRSTRNHSQLVIRLMESCRFQGKESLIRFPVGRRARHVRCLAQRLAFPKIHDLRM